MQKHFASRFTITTGRGGQWELSDEGDTDMTGAVVSGASEMRELTLDELEEAGGGLSTAAKIAITIVLVGAVGFLAGVGVGILLA